ncbi:MAG: nucleotidyltransferase domain-containing protein [Muribaculaceae bacterium]|nr:nucleotidyltransferase domain-containing protein [Muribaculaceae bacterium]
MLSENIKKIIPQMSGYLASQPVVRRLWIFGSCARGEETVESDVDFIVDYDRSHKLSLFTVGGIVSNLERIFGREVDFVEDGFLIPEAKLSSDLDKVLVYERKDS